MDNLILNYALLTSLWDSKREPIECFLPFIVKTLKNEDAKNIIYIHSVLESSFGYSIPIHVLENILNLGIKREYIEKADYGERYRLTGAGITFEINNCRDESEIRKEIDYLIGDLWSFLQKRGNVIDREGSEQLLKNFLRKNILQLIYFINPKITEQKKSEKKEESEPAFEEDVERALLEYIFYLQKTGNKNYKTMKKLIFGSILSVILYANSDSIIVKEHQEKFKSVRLYLDTNFVLSILEMRNDKLNRADLELFDLIKKYHFELRVFGFTVTEIRTLLKDKNNIENYGLKEEPIKSLLLNFDVKLEEKFKRMNITVEEYPDVDLSTYSIKESDISDRLNKIKADLQFYRPNQNKIYRNHDIAAVEKIFFMRLGYKRNLEDSVALFLTSDKKLAKSTFNAMGHRQSGTISEVILDSLLTNILWLLNPEMQPPLDTLISTYSQELLDNFQVWRKFFETAKKLEKEEIISATQISLLHYHGYIESILMDIPDENVDIVTEDFVRLHVQTAQHLPTLNSKRVLKDSATGIAQRDVKHIKLFIGSVVFFTLVWSVLTDQMLLTFINGLLTLLFILSNIGIEDFDSCWKKLEDYIFRKRYEQMRKDAKLDSDEDDSDFDPAYQ